MYVSESDTTNKEKGQKITLKNADRLYSNRNLMPDVQMLSGNVIFEHGTAVMYSDSAYLNDVLEEFKAMSNVHMVQNDTIHIYANSLLYRANEKIAYLRNNVRMENGTTTLFTDSLDYDRNQNLAFYFDGGSIVDEKNTLTSEYAQYSPDTKDATFTNNVVLSNDSMTMNTEYLVYNTDTKISRIDGFTEIKSSSGTIISNKGIYDTNKNIGILLNRSEIYSADSSKKLVGDSIYYDGNLKTGEAFGRMLILDTIQKVELHGDYGYFDQVKNYAFVTGRAYAIDYSNPEDTSYIAGDTLELISVKMDSLSRNIVINNRWQRDSLLLTKDSLKVFSIDKSLKIDSVSKKQIDSLRNLKDSISKFNEKITAKIKKSFVDTATVDTLKRFLKVYKNVKMYSDRGQAISDSLHYSSVDSILRMFGKSYLFRENSQIRGDSIYYVIENNNLKYANLSSNVLGIQYIDSVDLYNQLKADNLVVELENNNARKITATGNVKSIYYLYDEKNTAYTGMNSMSSSSMIIDIDSNKMKKSYWKGPVDGKVYPMSMSNKDNVNRLEGFEWKIDLRPKDKFDIIDTVTLSAKYKPNLIELRKFSGLQAALKAYAEYEPKLDTTANNGVNIPDNSSEVSSQNESDNKENKDNSSQKRLYIYPDIEAYDRKSINIDIKKWVYYFSNKDQ